MSESKSTNGKQSVGMPNLNVNVIPSEAQKESELVKAEQIVGFYNEILNDIRDDRKEIDEVLKSFLEMVMNEGDATTSSKEALVNLIKLKAEAADKKTRVVDLLMRAFLKEKDTYPRYLAAHQENTINIDVKRKLLNSILEDKTKGVDNANKH